DLGGGPAVGVCFDEAVGQREQPDARGGQSGQVESLPGRGIAGFRDQHRRSASAASPAGTLMKKIHLQVACSVSSPPASGRIDRGSEETPAQMPMAVPRWRGGKVAVMIDSVAGFISAAPRPCTARPPIRTALFGASPQASEAPAKTVSPAMKTSRRRNRSASLPPVSMKAANVRA